MCAHAVFQGRPDDCVKVMIQTKRPYLFAPYPKVSLKNGSGTATQ